MGDAVEEHDKQLVVEAEVHPAHPELHAENKNVDKIQQRYVRIVPKQLLPLIYFP